MPRVHLTIAWMMLGALAPACGSRSALLEGADADGPSSGGAGGRDAGATDSPRRVDQGQPDHQDTLLPCPTPQWHDPTQIVAFADRHAEAPSMVVLEPGAEDKPASVAIQVLAGGGSSPLHTAVQLARIRVGLPWPSATVLDKPPQLFGIESHGWGEMEPAAQGLALAWHGDPGGKGRPMFRRFNTASWKADKPVDIAKSGEAVLALGHDAGGFAAIWRDVQTGEGSPTRPLLALLNGAGTVTHGPYPVAPAGPYPGRSPDVVWAGNAYLVATAYSSCDQTDDGPPCLDRHVIISRVDPPTGLVQVSSIPALSPEQTPGRRAVLATHGDRAWVAWTEGSEADPEGPRAVRLARLTPAGKTVGAPLVVAKDAPMISAVSLAATPLGLVLIWAERGIEFYPPSEPGYSRLVVVWLDLDGAALHGRHEIPITQFNHYSRPQAVALAGPQGLLLAWAGSATKASQPDVAYLALVQCSKGAP